MTQQQPTVGTRRTTAVTLLALAALLAGGCTTSKGDTVPTKSQADAEQLVETYRTSIATTLTADPTKTGTKIGVTPVPCKDNGTSESGPYQMQGTYNIALPEAQHQPALSGLRDGWRSKNYTITEDLHHIGTSTWWGLTARNPVDGFEITAYGVDPKTIALMILTPCYTPPTP